MTEQTHLIALDSTADIVAVKDYLKADCAFTHWWNHVPGGFLVTSDLTANEITNRIRQFAGESSFFVVGVRLDDAQGWLPRGSWIGSSIVVGR